MAYRYWVGGTGNTSDTAHWSLSSGGAPGAPKPSASDAVSFDAQSFSGTGQIVTVDDDMVCGSMDWTGALYSPKFFLDFPHSLSVNGNLTLIAAMDFNINNHLNFDGVNTITSPGTWGGSYGHIHLGRVTTCAVTLASDLNLGQLNDIEMAHGSLNTQNYNITCNFFWSTAGLPAFTLTLGSSTISLYDVLGTNPPGVINLSAEGFVLNAGTSTFLVYGNDAADRTINTGGQAFNNLAILGSANFTTIFSGGGSFNLITVLRNLANKTIKITSGTTLTTGGLACTASSNRTLTITNTTGATPGVLTRTGGGVGTINYINLSYNTGTPTDAWKTGAQATVGAGVTGWDIGSPFTMTSTISKAMTLVPSMPGGDS